MGSKLESDDDPRPEHMRNRPAFNDEVLMHTVNFTAVSGIDIAFRYQFSRADMNAAAADHNYFGMDFRKF